MNDFFCNIGEKLSSNIPNTVDPPMNGDYSANSNYSRFEFRMLSPDDLVNVMAKFKKINGFGVDGISSFFLKFGMPVLEPGDILFIGR